MCYAGCVGLSGVEVSVLVRRRVLGRIPGQGVGCTKRGYVKSTYHNGHIHLISMDPSGNPTNRAASFPLLSHYPPYGLLVKKWRKSGLLKNASILRNLEEM